MMLTVIAFRTTLDAERELLRCLGDKEPTFVEFSHYLSESVLFPPAHLSVHADWMGLLLNRFRTAAQNAILLDFDAAREYDIEGRLWDAHLKLNTRFRKKLSRVSADH
jgi:hypothetical protein